jgi:hypothetical protein
MHQEDRDRQEAPANGICGRLYRQNPDKASQNQRRKKAFATLLPFFPKRLFLEPLQVFREIYGILKKNENKKISKSRRPADDKKQTDAEKSAAGQADTEKADVAKAKAKKADTAKAKKTDTAKAKD